MISIEFDPVPVVAADHSISGTMELLGRLLDRCEAENIRDVALRLPTSPALELGAALRPVLGRPFRFSAWFRGVPPLALADVFLSVGHRVTIGAVVSSNCDDSLLNVLKSAAYLAGASWQVSLFLAWSAAHFDFTEGLDGVEPRSGTNVTLGVSWKGLDSGPSVIQASAERDWARVLPKAAAWWTERGVTVHLACGLPLCMFSTGQLGDLALQRIRQPLARCAPGLAVTLDGRARVCPRLPAEGWTPMPAGVALRELEDRLIGSSSSFAAFCNRAAEQSCRSLGTGACGGGCMAHNALMWRGNGEGTNYVATV